MRARICRKSAGVKKLSAHASRGPCPARVLEAAAVAGFEHVVTPPADATGGPDGMRRLYFPLDMHLNPEGAGAMIDLLYGRGTLGVAPPATCRTRPPTRP